MPCSGWRHRTSASAADDLAVGEAGLRLVVDQQLVVLDRVPELRGQRQAPRGCGRPGRRGTPRCRSAVALASYIATSAHFSSAETSVGVVRASIATPMLPPDSSVMPVDLVRPGRAPSRSSRATVDARRPRRATSGSSTAELVAAEPGDRGAWPAARPGRRRATSSSRRSPLSWPSVSLTSLNPSRSISSTANAVPRRALRRLRRPAPGTCERFGRPVSASWSAWNSRSLTSRLSWSMSRPFSSATLAWFASVRKSRAASPSNVLTSPTRSPTVIVPITPHLPSSGATIASRTPSCVEELALVARPGCRGATTATRCRSIDRASSAPARRSSVVDRVGVERRVGAGREVEDLGRRRRRSARVTSAKSARSSSRVLSRIVSSTRSARSESGDRRREVVEEREARVALGRARCTPRYASEQHGRDDDQQARRPRRSSRAAARRRARGSCSRIAVTPAGDPESSDVGAAHRASGSRARPRRRSTASATITAAMTASQVRGCVDAAGADQRVEHDECDAALRDADAQVEDELQRALALADREHRRSRRRAGRR